MDKLVDDKAAVGISSGRRRGVGGVDGTLICKKMLCNWHLTLKVH